MPDLTNQPHSTPPKKVIPFDETPEGYLLAESEGDARHAEQARKAQAKAAQQAAANQAAAEQRKNWFLKSRINLMKKNSAMVMAKCR